MNDWDKSKAQLIEEIASLRAEVARLRQESGVALCDQSVSALDPFLTLSPSEETCNQVIQDNNKLQSESLFNSFFGAAAHSNLGLFILDSELRFLHLNQALAAMNGYSVETHLGKPLPDLLPDLAPTFVPVLTTILETGKPVPNLEISGHTPSQPDTLRHWLTALFPITNAAGQVVVIGGSIHEVTELRQLLEQLQQNEFNWGIAQRIAHVGSWQFDYLTETVTWSEEVYRIHGCDPTLPPPQGQALEQYIHPDDRERFQQLMIQAKAGKSFEMELRIIRTSDDIRYVEARGEPGVFDEQGQLIRIFGTLLDITDRKQTEIALRRSEFALREAQKIAHVGHWHLDRATQTIVWSDEVFRIHGLDPSSASMVIADIDQFLHPDDREMRDRMFAAALAGQSSEADLRIVRPNGEVWCIEARCSPQVFNEQGEVLEVFGTVLDVTDRKRAEAALRQSEANLARAQKIAKLGHWEYDLTSQTTTWSDELYAIHQIDPSQPPPSGEAMDQLIHPDDLWIDRQQIKAPLLAGKPCQADLRIVRQDGEICHVEARGEPIYDTQGNIIRWVGTLFDITDRKRIEEKLRRSEAEMAAILKAMPDMLIRVTKNGKRALILPGTLTSGKPIDQPQDQSLYQLLPAPLAKQRMDHVNRAIETGERQVYEYDIPINGAIRKEEARIVAINNDEALIIVRDITEKYQFEQMKDEFIAMVSHELRTPLTSMQVALSLLDEQFVDPSSEDGQKMIHIANEGVDRLVRLVNDLLDLQRLESGQLHLKQQLCHTQDLIDNAMQAMQDLAKQSNITIVTMGTSYPLQADPDRIVQVLTNLLSNAIRFSHSGATVWVTVKALGSEASQGIIFSVQDQGRGIPAEKLESIFERFQQADASDYREKRGTGLGLNICQKIVQQHGGRIWAESTLGQGSTFYFTVPVAEGYKYDKQANLGD